MARHLNIVSTGGNAGFTTVMGGAWTMTHLNAAWYVNNSNQSFRVIDYAKKSVALGGVIDGKTTVSLYGNVELKDSSLLVSNGSISAPNGEISSLVLSSDSAAINKLKVPTSASIGKVLTSDSQGNATWQDPSGVVQVSQSLVASFDAGLYKYNNYTLDSSWTNLNMNGDPSKKFTNVRVSSTTHIWGRVTGVSRNGYEQAAYNVWAQVENIGGVIRVKSSEVTPLFEDIAQWDMRFAVEDTTKIINFQVKGSLSDTVFWSGQFSVNEAYYLDPQSNWTIANLLGPDSLMAWYDATQHQTKFTESLGDTTWVIPDISGRDNHAIRTSAPKYVYRDSCYYGDAAVNSSGYAINQSASTGLYMPTLAHFFFVAERSTAGSNGVVTINMPVNGMASVPGLGDGFVRNSGSTVEAGVPFTGTAGRPMIVECILTADSIVVYCNGELAGRNLVRGTTMTIAQMVLLSNSTSATSTGFKGNFKEMVIIRGKNLDAPTRIKALTYFRQKHKI